MLSFIKIIKRNYLPGNLRNCEYPYIIELVKNVIVCLMISPKLNNEFAQMSQFVVVDIRQVKFF